MKLILKQAVPNLGEAGDVVDVKAGYGRNFLLPQGLAYEASQANLKRIEAEKARAEEQSRRDYLEARRRASQIEGTTLTFQERATEDEEEARLFGSVSADDIVARLNELDIDFSLHRREVLLEEPIKELGTFPVTLRLHAEVELDVEVVVQRADG
ncbi:MAG: 50S ribosomal protein L9 [Gemmatimonadales bacterium]|nr:MAG: 50S ribosomal protein L9 [Gemmatimonadales bacterium]